MNKLKNLLQYDASKYIFVGLATTLFIFTKTSYISILLLLILLLFLKKKAKNLFKYSLLFVLIIGVRMAMIDHQDLAGDMPGRLEIVDIKTDYLVCRSNGLYYIYCDNPEVYQIGNIIALDGYEIIIKAKDISNTFSYQMYLKSHNVKKLIRATDIKLVGNEFSLSSIRYRLKTYIDENYSEKSAEYIKLFVLGDKENVNQELMLKVNYLGISHLFAISGMHLALLIGFLNMVIGKFYLKKTTHRNIIIIFLLCYNIITGFQVSILRASLLVFALYLKEYFDTILSKTDLLTFSFLGFLIINPYYLYSVGFQLSYLVSVSIILGSSVIQSDNYFIRIFLVSVFATLVSLPITLGLNKTFGIFNPVANVFFVIFVSILMLPLSFITLFIPQISSLFEMVIGFFEKSVSFFSDNNLMINLNFSNNLYKVLYWILLLLFMLACQSRKRIVEAAFVLIVFMILSFSYNLPPKLDFVRILDVDQGDSIHLHNQNCDMLIDTGKADDYHTVYEYFRSYNITDLDILLITHFHADHYGELMYLNQMMNISRIYLNRDLIELRNDSVLSKGDTFACGEYRFMVLNANNSDSNENNNSIVLYASIDGDKWLFTGDIESDVENQIVSEYNLNIDVLKVPHHGSMTSSTDAFLNAIKPQTAIISVGIQNEYNLPDISVIDKYHSKDIRLYRTDLDGTVTFYYLKSLDIRITETYLFMKKKRYHFELT